MAENFERSWNNHLRQASRSSAAQRFLCPLCNREVQNASDLAIYQRHVQTSHETELSQTSDDERVSWIRNLWRRATQTANDRSCIPSTASNWQSGPGSQEAQGDSDSVRTQASSREDSGDESSPVKVKQEPEEDLPAQPSPKLSKAWAEVATPQTLPAADDTRAEFARNRSQQKGQLWDPNYDATRSNVKPYDSSNVATRHRLPVTSPSHIKALLQQNRGGPNHQQRPEPPSQPAVPWEEEEWELLKQPETRPISLEQLVNEVKGIYAGLVMIETKCVDVDSNCGTAVDPYGRMTAEQWQALIGLHRTLLHEHHDFFLASQHPSATPQLRRLAPKYAMPARMWRNGIHSFLEMQRHRLPHSFEHMLTFIYMAYSMMGLLLETVPVFEDTWIECLGDLARYRMAIEDECLRDRETWTVVSRGWYKKASDKQPSVGRLYHHLAILARPSAIRQLFYYSKSLCVEIPFEAGRDSMMTLINPILEQNSSQASSVPPIDLAFVQCHGVMFSRKKPDMLSTAMAEFLGLLDNCIGRAARDWLEPGHLIGIANCCAVVGYGFVGNPIWTTIKPQRDADAEDPPPAEDEADTRTSQDLANALQLANKTHDVVLRRFGDPNVLSYFHVTLVFMNYLTSRPEAIPHVAPSFPWKLAALMLNTLLSECRPEQYPRIEGKVFPRPEEEDELQPRPLPEDWALRGLVWAADYFPSGWFSNDKLDEDERHIEIGSHAERRKERVLYLGCQIAAKSSEYLRYDSQAHQFNVSPQYDIDANPAYISQADSSDLGELPDAPAAA